MGGNIIKKKIKDKKAISVMIGYVLLISAAVVMSVIVYQWLRSYVPSESLECPSDASLFITQYTCGYQQLDITLKNNGRFGLAGYFIHVANESGQELATIDVSNNITSGGNFAGGSIVFVQGGANTMMPNDEKISSFDFNGANINQIYLVEIIPARFQEIEDKLTFVSCGNAKIREQLTNCNMLCYDSDGGENLFEQATCEDGTDLSPYLDECDGNSAVHEYSCQTDNTCKKSSKGCPSEADTCSEGACV